MLSQSATENERGTPRYFAPEVYEYQRSGRAADIFSLGCILLEIIVLHKNGTMQQIRDTRRSNPCFHANLDRINSWLPESQNPTCPQALWLECEVRRMMATDPHERPNIEELLTRAAASELVRNRRVINSIFGACCKINLESRDCHGAVVAASKQDSSKTTQRYHHQLESKEVDHAELELRFCKRVLAKIVSSKYKVFSYPFMAPVDPVALAIPSYFEIIKKPMDLGTIANTLKEGEYKNAKEFYADIRLMFDNCYKFNPEGDPVNRMGHDLEAVFERHWRKKSDWLTSRSLAPES